MQWNITQTYKLSFLNGKLPNLLPIAAVGLTANLGPEFGKSGRDILTGIVHEPDKVSQSGAPNGAGHNNKQKKQACASARLVGRYGINFVHVCSVSRWLLAGQLNETAMQTRGRGTSCL